MKLSHILEARLANRWTPSKATKYWLPQERLDPQHPDDVKYWNWVRENEKALDIMYYVLEETWYRWHDEGTLGEHDFRRELKEYHRRLGYDSYDKLSSGNAKFLDRAVNSMWEILDEH